MKISVFGMGYVGIATAVSLAELGHNVLGVDVQQNKIDGLKNGSLPMHEPELRHYLNKSLEQGKIIFETDLGKSIGFSDLIFICLGTPSMSDGSADMSEIVKLCLLISEQMESDKTVVIKSTVPIGTAEKLKNRAMEKMTEREVVFKFDVVSNPEFLREGFAWQDSVNPFRIVIGSDCDRARDRLLEIYDPCKFKCPIILTSFRSSEMAKYASNAMLAARISMMNEIAQLCESSGADIIEVTAAVGTDPRIGEQYLSVGVGYGGSCLPKDTRALLAMGRRLGRPMKMLEMVNEVNQDQKNNFFSRIEDKISGFKGKKIGIWGTAFKPDTDDIRESPALEFLSLSLKAGAELSIFDPLSIPKTRQYLLEMFPQIFNRIHFSSSPMSALEEVDLLVIFNSSACFDLPDLNEMKVRMKLPIIFDGRNAIDAKQALAMGFSYCGIGRGNYEFDKK